MSDNKQKSSNLNRNALFDLSGKVALVTGGGSGIGLMATQALAENGAKVYITGRTLSKLNSVVDTYGSHVAGSIIPLTCDVTKKSDITSLYTQIAEKESGGLHILVNNAGIVGAHFEKEANGAEDMKKKLFESDEATFEDWGSTYHTLVSQMFFMSTAFLPLLQKATENTRAFSGTIINITSISGMVQDSQGHHAYNAAKGAAIHLSRMLAQDVSRNKLAIRVNSLAPGVFPSEMTTDGSNEDQKSHIEKEKFEGKIAAGRPGKDEDMAQTILFFAANQYLNGQNVAVDGGFTLAAGL